MPENAIAIVGMACRYPDAGSPEELWRNVLAQRRAFRRMPAERLRLEDYFSTDPNALDSIYTTNAALIEGYEFDRARFRVARSTFDAVDLVHWLALDIASQALADAGFPDGAGLARETTGVIVGNTLTGEFSRANTLRLRWPYVRRVTDAALRDAGWPAGRRKEFLATLEGRYTSAFPPMGEETLAGGLSNTIAGRICNHFDLKGGGYTVDAACAASLLAVTTACAALTDGDLDAAIAGGVDLSLDPFELVGFARAGALARHEMRVYDARSSGFWPGEGCGFVVLMRHRDARSQGRRVYAVIRGWGVASDGAGGITRPEAEGQLLAVRRAYRRAGFAPSTVAYFEGHGTGTSVGDAVELEVLSRALRETPEPTPPAAIGSIKANIGHTKAAAGVAGLIKATLALHHQILPPTSGNLEPHPLLAADDAALRVLDTGEPWPSDCPLRAAVSAMGFGGIDTHAVLEAADPVRRGPLDAEEQTLLSTPQDAEVFLFGAPDAGALRDQVGRVAALAGRVSLAEMADLAAALERGLAPSPRRAAVVASTPAELDKRLDTLRVWLGEGVEARLAPGEGVFLGTGASVARIGFLFPGQGSPSHVTGGVWRRRFGFAAALYHRLPQSAQRDSHSTDVAQPAIVTGSLLGLRALAGLGIRAGVAVGHSLGELTALHWAAAFDEDALARIAAARGRAMAALGSATGAMASLAAGEEEAQALIAGQAVVIAGLNAPRQTVISGEEQAVAAVMERARARGVGAARLPVSHAFHSPLVAAAAPALAGHLAGEAFGPPARRVISTVTGGPLGPEEDLRALLCRQVTSPVRFAAALRAIDGSVDLWLEVGPGRVLSDLAAQQVRAPALALDVGGASLAGWLGAAGAAYALGAPVRHEALFAGRFTKPFDLEWRPRFLANPCERAPLPEAEDMALAPTAAPLTSVPTVTPVASGPAAAGSALEVVRELVARRAELPPAAVRAEDRLLADLHLNSIVVGQLAAEAARRLALPAPVDPTAYAGATVSELAGALEELRSTRGGRPAEPEPALPAGVDAWVRPFTVELLERPLPRRPRPAGGGAWRVFAPAGHPLAARLERALAACGTGVVVCLPPEPDERCVALLLQAARALWPARATSRFVMVQHGGGAAAFARTLHLESPETTTCVVDVPPDHPRAADWVAAEALAALGYSEAHYDRAGRRREPALSLLELGEDAEAIPLGPSDVLLVSGGGKGIAAECALALARESGAKLGLLGRARPQDDPALAANLERMAVAGIVLRYVSADVTAAAAVRAAVRQVEASLGPVTALLHGAGANRPRPLSALDEETFHATLAPKVLGARNLLDALDRSRLHLFLAFGSVIARTGMRGEADYAVANEWLTALVERHQGEHPHCRCLCLEWSVWSGVGMGERLGRVDALVAQGITPITPEVGVRMLRRLAAARLSAATVVVTGRLGEPATLALRRPELPLQRFLERPRVYVPGVELVVDVELSGDADPYLDHHAYRGERLFPAVMGLEAMAEAAMALAGAAEMPVFTDVAFHRPVAVSRGASETLRVGALRRESGVVEVAVRCATTGFQVNHFEARCTFGSRGGETRALAAGADDPAPDPRGVTLDPDRDLYGALLFQSGPFKRLRGYRWLRSTACLAEIGPDGKAEWFGPYLPGGFVLGDPGARDAAIHAIQACIPHVTLLPVAVERLAPAALGGDGPFLVQARERRREGNTFVYDLEIADAQGRVLERWTGLALKAAGEVDRRSHWASPLLGPYVERRVAELIPGASIQVAIEPHGDSRPRSSSEEAIARLLGGPAPVRKRPDGKPERIADPERAVSASDADSLRMVVAGRRTVGCDLEPVVPRAAKEWDALLGGERRRLAAMVAREAGEDEAAAATRVWAAQECMKKAGVLRDAPLVLHGANPDGWVVFASGPLRLATFVAALQPAGRRMGIAVLAEGDHARV